MMKIKDICIIVFNRATIKMFSLLYLGAQKAEKMCIPTKLILMSLEDQICGYLHLQMVWACQAVWASISGVAEEGHRQGETDSKQALSGLFLGYSRG